MTKVNKWTLGLAAVGLVSLPAVVQAEEKPNQVLTALASTTISGYVDTSAHWTLGSGNNNPPAYAYNGKSKQDGFNLNVVDVTIEKPLDEGTWSAGYKIELWFGPNAGVLGNNIGGSTASTAGGGGDLAIKQAFVDLRVPVGNGLDIKIGTFDTIIGYETANATTNPNYTRSYGYTIEPTQNTGILATYNVNKLVSLSGGIVNTWSAGLNNRSARGESNKGYMGSVTLTAPDSFGPIAGSSLYAGIVDGYNSQVGNDATSFYLGGTLATPIKKLKLGAAWDYLHIHDNSFNSPTIGGHVTGYAQSVAVYASVQATEKLGLHLRGEWFDITDGAASNGTSAHGTQTSLGGIPSEALAITGTIQYDLWANVLSRLELRWDHSLAEGKPFGGSSGGVAGSSKKNEVLVAANIIYKF